MGQETDSEEDTVDDIDLDDEEWDDLDDDLESFEEKDTDLQEEKKTASKLEKSASKQKKKSGTGLLMGLMALATLGSVSWLALGNNPQIMSLVLGMTSGEKINQHPTVELDQAESADVPTAAVQVTAPETSDIPNLGEPSEVTDQAAINIDGTVAGLPAAAPEIVPPQDNTTPSLEDDGVLTPLPDLTDLEKEPAPAELSAQIEPLEKSALEIPDAETTPPNLAEIEELPAVSLEEEKLLEQTEKTLSVTQETDVPESLDVQEIPALEAKEPDEAVSTVQMLAQDDSAAKASPVDEGLADIVVKSENIAPSAVSPTTPKETAQPEVSKKEPEKLQNSMTESPVSDVKPKEKKPAEAETLKTTEKNPSPVQEKPKKALPVWELRSASTGSAVIHDKSTGNVLSIGVGSTVNGIGRVKSIEKHDGKWRVTGTIGSIHQ